MKAELNTPKYSELYQQKFLDAFPPKALPKLNKEQQSFLKELAGFVYTLTLEEVMNKSTRFADIARKLRNKNPDKWYYEIDSEELQTDEVLFLIVYPFWSRMGGSFEEQFALDGRLGKYLRLLKKRETSG